jgi:histidine ammonia-lyase
MRGTRPRSGVLADAFAAAVGVLDPRTEDRPLDADLIAAAHVLPVLARI